jgi:hypothetical protein
MTRRAALLAGIGVSVGAAIAAGIPPAIAEPVAVADGYWGFSWDDEVYHRLDAPTQEEALKEALQCWPDGDFNLAWCEERPIVLADYPEVIMNHMAGSDSSFRSAIVEASASANEDADFEGEIAGDMYRADAEAFEDECRLALDAALARNGFVNLVGRDFDQSPIDSEHPVFTKLEADEEFKRACNDAAQRWFDRNGFWGAGPRVIDISQAKKVPPAVTSAEAADV